MLKSSSTSYFKYFAIINSAREANALLVGDLLTGLLYLYIKQANYKAKAISPLSLFFIAFSDTKTYFKNNHRSCPIKKAFLKILEYAEENVLGFLFHKVFFRTVARLIFYTYTYDFIFLQVKP